MNLSNSLVPSDSTSNSRNKLPRVLSSWPFGDGDEASKVKKIKLIIVDKNILNVVCKFIT